MALTFPHNPAISDVYSYAGNSWIWTGVAWKRLATEETFDGGDWTDAHGASPAIDGGSF